LEGASALHVSRTYYELKAARDNRGKTLKPKVDLRTVETIRERCAQKKRIPLTDEALAICGAAGLTPVPHMVVRTEKELKKMPLHYPLAVKLISRDASHKSDVGGVQLNIGSKKELSAAISAIQKAVRQAKTRPAIDGYLLQEMSPAGIECFVGGRRDPAFGPIIMAGLGGVFIEIFKDTALRLAPVTKNEAEGMLKELKAYPLLTGVRGKIPADIKALVDVICRVSALLNAYPAISEIDLNPVIVHPKGQGVSLVDARVFFQNESKP
jgi:acetyltransferase